MSSSSDDPCFQCSYCKNEFTDVVKLMPECGESICGKCHDDVLANLNASSQFECLACREVHVMPANGFPDNTSFSRFAKRRKLDQIQPLSDRVRSFKAQLDAVHAKLLTLLAFDGPEFVNQYCAELEIQVVESFESVFKHLNEVKEQLNQEIGDYKRKCLEALSRSNSSHQRPEVNLTAKVVSDFDRRWRDFFIKIEVTPSDRQIETAARALGHFESSIRQTESDLRLSALRGKRLAFKPSFSFTEGGESLRQLFNLNLRREDKPEEAAPLAVLKSHSREVNEAVFLSDGRLASCSTDKTIKLWDAEKGSLLTSFPAHSGPITCLAPLHNGWLASGSFDNKILVWDLDKPRPVRILSGHTHYVVTMKTMRNKTLASFSLDDTIRIWDPFSADRNLLHTISGHKNQKLNPLFDIFPNDMLVTCSRSKTSFGEVLRVWSPGDRKAVKSFETSTPKSRVLLVLLDGRVAVSSDNGTIDLFDLFKGTETITKRRAHHGPVTSLVQLSNGTLLSAGCEQTLGPLVNTIKFWHLPDFNLLQTISTDHSDIISHISLSPDEKLLVSAGKDRIIQVWAVATHFL